ncbi:hypothetical protein ACOSQ2_030579 [Xanthoceras sorbifolium]|uniref:Viral late gene transcription factor 3 zinc ribbon domain-containing protein n=1 Tax=Xanthoceras sorbifolium TaxID=99658 RepID=A0ABQ8H2P8_9ROSI|nr:hypothetical protein JRO89_XS15G0173000 [Xanthoceras sorbifolium]
METSSISPPLFIATPISNKFTNYSKSRVGFGFACNGRSCHNSIGNRRSLATISAINDVSSLADPARTEVTWQIIVGTLAGVTPFVVAGVEFSKRIIAQRRCEECGGSGLILREKDYYKCPQCGGFLPWQSWKRFFTG